MANDSTLKQLEQIPAKRQKYVVKSDQIKRDLGIITKVKREFIIPLEGFGKGAAKPTETNAGVSSGYAFSINDLGYFSFEVPTDWAHGTDIEIGIHWYINEAYATGSGEVQWAVIWLACSEDATEDPTAAGANALSGDINIPATANRLVETEIDIPGASLAHHDIILFQVKRVALVGGSDPTADPVIISLEADYKVQIPKALKDLTAVTATLIQDSQKQKILK